MSEEKSEDKADGGPEGFYVGKFDVYVCHVTGDGGLNIRTQPDTHSQIVFNASTGTPLNYFEIVPGETVNNNNCWGHSVEDHYYWMGGTDNPWC